MKKTIVVILALFFLILSLPTAAFSQNKIWNGTASDGFAHGDGSEENPYQIATAEQLAYLADMVNEGNDFAFCHFLLTNDLYLNNETFTFDADSGMVLVSDGKNQRYFGTGIAGDDSGSSTAFDQTPSEKGKWYLRTNDRIVDDYNGNYNHFTPIGSENKPFSGHFDGNGHTIHGLMILDDNHTDYGGLFGKCESGSICRLNIENALVVGNNNTGCIAGSGGNIRACRVNAIVLGKRQTGGIAGKGNITLGFMKGAVIGTDFQNVGGIVGLGNVSYSRNEAPVFGCENVGGVAGKGNGLLEYCENNGTIHGEKYVGGIAGIGTIDHATNNGKVTATLDPAGGIAGRGSVSYSANYAQVIGRNYVGGIVGEGISQIQACFNTASVEGDSAIGGIAGTANCNIYLCYNSGSVTGSYTWSGGFGGIAGHLKDIMSGVSYCYNVGDVRGPVQAGALVGTISGLGAIHYSYYRKDCAEDATHTQQCAVGCETKEKVNRYYDSTSKGKALSNGAMKVLQQFPESRFQANFEIDYDAEYNYPTLTAVHHGAHTFDQKSEKEAYLLYEGDCRHATTYYYACRCGMVGEETYTPGEALHTYDPAVYQSDTENHYHLCQKCGEKVGLEAHLYSEEPTDVQYPTQNEGAKITHTCSVCSAVKIVQLAGADKGQGIKTGTVLLIGGGALLGILGTLVVFALREFWIKKRKE